MPYDNLYHSLFLCVHWNPLNCSSVIARCGRRHDIIPLSVLRGGRFRFLGPELKNCTSNTTANMFTEKRPLFRLLQGQSSVPLLSSGPHNTQTQPQSNTMYCHEGGLYGSSETDDCEEAVVCWHHKTVIHQTDGCQELWPNKTKDPQLQSDSFHFAV